MNRLVAESSELARSAQTALAAGRTDDAQAPQPPVFSAAAHLLPQQTGMLERARAFAEPLLTDETLRSGENALAHADAVAAILRDIGGSEAMQTVTYLIYASFHLSHPQEAIARRFGETYATLALETSRLMHVQHQARSGPGVYKKGDAKVEQAETVRKMLLAFSRDLRVVLIRLASRLQTLRHHASSKTPIDPILAQESLYVFAPLAHRLGVWQLKWELEDLAFRFLEPETYRSVAKQLDEKRREREQYMQSLCALIRGQLTERGIDATVQGRPKHIYSIVKKMRGKSLSFDQLYDLRAVRIIVPTVQACYETLDWVHSRFTQVSAEFDDYIARPKPNGYQSLHTVVRDAQGRAVEVQIRTQAMHDHAETGVAAHWAYKEAGTKGYAGVSASGDYDAKIAVLRQLLAWEREFADSEEVRALGLFDDRIYVLTPDASIVELPRGATPVDFAYTVHTSLGHRCRGAKVDGAMVALNTPLENGQTVEITAVKEGGPSRDWLNKELGYLQSSRARSKVRAWFNAQALAQTIAKGREIVEKVLQREGKTALKLEDIAAQLGFKSTDAFFEVVGKDEFSLRTLEVLLHPEPAPEPAAADDVVVRKPRSSGAGGKVLVVGMDSLMTHLAKCCMPAPPDAIGGFITRGKGVGIHRQDCPNFQKMLATTPERIIDVQWSQSAGAESTRNVYPVDILLEAHDRQGLLRDISDVLARERTNVIGVQTRSHRNHSATMTFTIEVPNATHLQAVLAAVAQVPGVRTARRK
ncbi:bifunctional (p)ppGpp synthetase/guanosine-3',5'-bis(diphosphate) 3'-pyrophosphohydrolase [Allofranklinella schreckenbergeri]|uniref:GTP pyrophosphokinase n=1 Tax=Allofranklinella schreckenbergeri TaxID=1076744 RepID=A0A3M6QBX0_9BURK|nr:bifunctional (p)ppGpp synthetase/guanosine-3',5'-bis(diphosphate) 3'-pyrophosphohydrolase [Allofranklinella schreckenbergeri]RMX00646.1 bifunctional (p)ppGpp synthetase/guanosine-3',5'-bis(diphosphate) 3'-pyrophosphohydrolase [Allofranklinella schreckenbergeri]RMX00972.1 bifunctional (p)ppGpp synthetase/guanosine-3',5'-bis(diphosphate) 3'-pyrophosphohydrolase [Allofranklinella schreckenbergeri]RMX07393.1 bifunctional (p)ppGpp synthetase/guanosine-3',5'-bis(diphosphate) 3'-pyrophosphohydrolase